MKHSSILVLLQAGLLMAGCTVAEAPVARDFGDQLVTGPVACDEISPAERGQYPACTAVATPTAIDVLCRHLVFPLPKRFIEQCRPQVAAVTVPGGGLPPPPPPPPPPSPDPQYGSIGSNAGSANGTATRNENGATAYSNVGGASSMANKTREATFTTATAGGYSASANPKTGVNANEVSITR